MKESTMTATTRADAQNRAWRTLIQGLAFDVGTAIILVLSLAIPDLNNWGDIEWAILGFSVVKSAVMAALAYLMRTVFRRKFPVTT
jgi:hypothetical protein